MATIRVIVHGALGKVGREVVNVVSYDPEMKLVGVADLKMEGDSLALPDGTGSVPASTNIESILTKCPADVMVDFTIARAAAQAAQAATRHGVNVVIGTTGLSADEVNQIGQLASERQVGVVIAPNFALGAVLMMHLAKIAARYLDYVEIIELHHHLKADAPSGTALATARAMAAARGRPFLRPAEPAKAQPSRGEPMENITIHSVRLPGLMAHQEVIFGALGQTLSIRHDSISRESFMPGVMLAIREVVKRQGLIYGLESILNL